MEDEIKGKAKGGKARAEKLSSERKKEIAKKAAQDRWAKHREGVMPKDNDNSHLVAIMPSRGVAVKQDVFEWHINKQVEIDGVGMGVLTDGTAFLTGRGLARLCGVNQSKIQAVTDESINKSSTPRMSKIQEILRSHSVQMDTPYIAIKQRSGVFYAYPDVVCLAILEYYAFDAGTNIKDIAKRNYRLLAGKALRDFIYTQVGYDPDQMVPDAWKQFHDRVSLTYNSVPKGYFGIFKEMSDMIVTLGQAGLHIDSSFVPDISVGMAWSKYWDANNFNFEYGERARYKHNYPEYFPQSDSNPQEPWCYPENALGEFRKWFRDVYIKGGKFKNYIEGKVQQKQLPVSFAQLAISAYGMKD